MFEKWQKKMELSTYIVSGIGPNRKLIANVGIVNQKIDKQRRLGWVEKMKKKLQQDRKGRESERFGTKIEQKCVNKVVLDSLNEKVKWCLIYSRNHTSMDAFFNYLISFHLFVFYFLYPFRSQFHQLDMYTFISYLHFYIKFINRSLPLVLY